MEEHSIRLGGREFAPILQELSAAQDDYILAHLRRSGALEALGDAEIPAIKRGEEMLTRVMLSGETFAVLSGILTEKGKQWSRAEAERNAAAFAALTDADSKQAMRGSLVGFVIGFLGLGAKSPKTSRKSSGRNAKGRATASAAQGTSATSPTSSAPSRDTTPSASAR